jgi:amino acid adenylation domain-containing protein
MKNRADLASRKIDTGIDVLLHEGFLRSCRRAPGRPALEVDGRTLSYGELQHGAAALAATLIRHTPGGGSPLTAVFAHRSGTAFEGILGALLAGRGYVPLNRTLPPTRTSGMLQRSESRSLIVDSRSEEQLDRVLEGMSAPLLIILPERQDVRAIADRWPEHVVLGSQDLEPADKWAPQPVSPDDPAYLLFTSGSTGAPKGVMVTHRNVMHFVDVMLDRYGITADDRCSQMFDATFDLSVLDMFVAWHAGACLCCPGEKTLLNPDKYIRQSKLTVWSSVPSVALLMKRFGILKPDRYDTLRWSLFCGEPLPVEVAAAWARAASNSVLENLYGPTELTVACSMYRWEAQRAVAESRLGIVPIGYPAPGMNAIVVDEELQEVPPGAIGELLMTGPQVTPGYWLDDVATARSYVRAFGGSDVYYRTGDRVRRPIGDEPMTYIGRADQQIKVLGYRVELGEIESRLREEPGVEAAVAVGWPRTAAGAAGIVAFVTGADIIDPSAIRTNLTASLPVYAVPHAIHVLPELPLNSNGKVDRNALLRALET